MALEGCRLEPHMSKADEAQLARFPGRWERFPGALGALSSSQRLWPYSLDKAAQM